VGKDNIESKRRIAVIGSTGSIGTQALDVIARNSNTLCVEVLSANNNADLLIEQAIRFKPNTVVIVNKELYGKVFEALDPYDIKVFAGQSSLCDVVQMSTIDIVLMAVVGFAGLQPTLKAIESKKIIALSNKETLVVAGSVITKKAKEVGVPIIPVDSEHSAIFQCLQGEMMNNIKTILLTASGGPFLHKKKDELANITPQMALSNPNWQMGNKVTIDSATLMNKGLEVIEAHWLFDVDSKDISAVIHSQSIVHSMVEFEDGSIKAQMAMPDMRLPIQYALLYPMRVASELPRLDIFSMPSLTFEKPDTQTFPCLNLAYKALEKGGNMPTIMNSANEIAVEAFLKGKINFLDIPMYIEGAMDKYTFEPQADVNTFLETDALVRQSMRDKLLK
jgi:1-deoxy-D-xylulose 5-phosphate reductoisomerase